MVLLDSEQSPKTQLFSRFWLHEHKWAMSFADSVVRVLSSQTKKFDMETIIGFEDFTECFKDDFEKPAHKKLLGFLTHTDIEQYPPAVVKTCIDYLASVAEGKPREYKLQRATSIIVCGNQ